MRCLPALLHYLLLLIGTTEASLLTQYASTIMLNCQIKCLRKEWAIRIEVRERDPFKDDIIASIGPQLVKGPWYRFNLTGIAKSDGFETHFDLFVRVTHNCTEDGTIHVFEQSLDSIPVTTGTKSFDLTKTIKRFENGKRVEFFVTNE